MPPDNVTNGVLQMIATMLRDQGERNEKQHKTNTDTLDVIKDGVSEIRTDFAVMAHDLSDIKMWREKTVDPFLNSARDGISQAKGAGKVAKLGYTAMGLIGGGVLYKAAVAFFSALPK